MSKSYEVSEVLNSGCQIRFGKELYYCYNVTGTNKDFMHFLKCGAKGQMLSMKNKNNLMNMKRAQVLTLIRLGSAFCEVGNIGV